METIPEKWRLREYSVPKARYTDPEFLQLEYERLFPNTWQMACREEEIPGPGNYYEYTIGRQSVLVVRQPDGAIAAFHNVCIHRGMKLLSGSGRVDEFRCRFHGWRYGLDGDLTFVHMPDEFEAHPGGCSGLTPVALDTWGGWVFIHMGEDPPPLLEWLQPMPDLLAPFNLEEMRYKWRKSTVVPCNWKCVVEAFVEGYHVAGTHPQMIRVHEGDPPSARPNRPEEFGAVAYTPSVTFENHSRFIYSLPPGAENDAERAARNADPARWASLIEYQNKHLGALSTDRDVRAAQSLAGTDLGDEPVAVAYLRACADLARAEGVGSYPELRPEQYFAASGDWNVIPTMVFLVEQSCLLGYRMRPNGDDPNSAIWDVYTLEHFAPGEVPDTKWEHYPVWRDFDWGQLITQDLKNMDDMQAGLHSRGFEASWLNTKQETAVINGHRVADRFLFGVDHGPIGEKG